MLKVILNYNGLTTASFDMVKEKYTDNTNKLNELILGLSLVSLTWNTLIQPTIDSNNNFIDSAYLEMKSFYESEELREYATDISTEIEQFDIENNMRKDLYTVYKYYYDNQYQTEKSTLNEEQINYMEDLIINYKKLGLDLPDEKYNRVKDIKKEISELTSAYSLNVDNYDREFVFNVNDVNGLPEKFIKDHIQTNVDTSGNSNQQIKVNLKYPDYVPMMEYCSNREIRKQLNYEFKRKAYDTNVEIAEKVFKLRQEQAELFGFDQHSDYKLQQTMAGSTDSVMTFLNNISEKIKPLVLRDYDILLSYAKKDNVDKLEQWDVSYYSRIHTEKLSNLNKEDLKQYFPVEATVENVFEIYQRLLTYKFQKTNTYKDTLWHKDVTMYDVYDVSDKTKYPKLIGYFYLDLFPRDGKYGHAAVFPFIFKSSSTLPVAAMACNFAKDLLTFDEVETFFHEFGHVMHHISSTSTISETASFNCEGDFVECPSQMFEEWCYNTKTLKILSPTLPDEIIEKIKIQRNILQGAHYARQLSFCLIDMHVHSKEFKGNSFDVVKKITKQVLDIDVMDNTNELSSFGHLMDGYDAGYYGYMWSLVYAKDLFSKFKGKELDANLGKTFLTEVLSQGSIRSSIDSMKKFLGRDPNLDAFIDSIV